LYSVTALAFAGGEGNIINPNGSLVVVLILFMLFIFVLNRLLFRPVSQVLDERDQSVEGDVNLARAAGRRSERKLAEYEFAIRNARADGYRLMERERAKALQERQALIDDAKSAAASDIERARAEIGNQAKQARTQLEADARMIAERISRTLLGRPVGGGGH
jgi:F-type H+-transporting ATPase subunit b